MTPRAKQNEPAAGQSRREALAARAAGRVAGSQPAPAIQRETVIIFAQDHHQAKAAWVEYCNEKGDDGVSRVCRYISDAYQLRGYRRKPDDPRQVVLFGRDWHRGAAADSYFYELMRRQGFIE